jgi:hypothetical protein
MGNERLAMNFPFAISYEASNRKSQTANLWLIANRKLQIHDARGTV